MKIDVKDVIKMNDIEVAINKDCTDDTVPHHNSSDDGMIPLFIIYS